VKGVGTVTPLITAANDGLTDFYNCLLEAGADPDVHDDVGFLLFTFPLHVFSTMKWLFTHGKLCKSTCVKLDFC
jgi:ankyrin repeat protein